MNYEDEVFEEEETEGDDESAAVCLCSSGCMYCLGLSWRDFT